MPGSTCSSTKDRYGSRSSMAISRREFIERSATLAAAGFAPRAGIAQTVRGRPQRVAVVGVGHYHAFSPPNYLRILQTEKTDIVGVHDPDAAIAAKYAAQVGSTPYTDFRAMIDRTTPEFVVALGQHAAMPAEFRYLVDTGLPFLMEK